MKERCGAGTGFTLIEVMAVVVIIGILATVAVVHMTGATEDTRREATRVSIMALRTAVLQYEVKVGEFPESLDQLVVEGDDDWPGPFLDEEEVPKDGWGNDFHYEILGKRYRITSAARDGQFGTEDDIWK